MSYIPKRVLYEEFPEEGVYGVTARQALEGAIDGLLPAYHLIFSSVTLYEYTREAPDPLTKNFNKWHGLTVRVPFGVLYTLNFYQEHSFQDNEGKPQAVLVGGPLGTPDMRPEVPVSEEYLLWPDGEPVTFDRSRLFFLRDDLQSFATGTNSQAASGRKTASSAAGEQVIEIERPSHPMLIAALLELLKAPVEFPRPQGMKQEAIKNEILRLFPWRGLSKRNIESMFSAANKASAEAE